MGYSILGGTDGLRRRFSLVGRTVPEGFPAVYISPYVQRHVPYISAGHPLAGGDISVSGGRPPSNFINWSDREGNAGRGGYAPDNPGWYLLGATVAQETRADGLSAYLPQTGIAAALGAVKQEKRFENLARLAEYDPGRVQGEIAELRSRFPDRPGMEAKDPKEDLPTIKIRGEDGRVLLQGKAESVEHLIALKLKEAATSTDPSKQTVNLAGAQLDEGTLGRKLEFKGMNFQNLDLRGANLGGARFEECQFKNVDMQGAGLKGSTFNLCHFENVNLSGFVGDKKTRFENSSMSNVDMSYAEAPGVKFDNIRAEYLNMQGGNFAGASIQNMKVDNLWAPQVNLEGAQIGSLQISGQHSSLEGAKLNRAEIGQSTFGTRDQPINMKGIEAQNSTWTDCAVNADVSKADFTGAAFTRVDMRNASTPEGPMIVQNADLTGLDAGAAVKMRASRVKCENVTMQVKDNAEMTFNGTADIHKAFGQANRAGLNHIELRPNGESFDAYDPDTGKKLGAEAAPAAVRRKPTPQPLPEFRPPSPYNKRNSSGA